MLRGREEAGIQKQTLDNSFVYAGWGCPSCLLKPHCHHLHLQHMSRYENMQRMSSSSCVPCEPISHRSFVINLIDDGDHGKRRRILVKRLRLEQDRFGRESLRNRKVKYLEVLVKAGISVTQGLYGGIKPHNMA